MKKTKNTESVGKKGMAMGHACGMTHGSCGTTPHGCGLTKPMSHGCSGGKKKPKK